MAKSWMAKWEKELNRTFSPGQRPTIIRFSLKSSICTKIQETNYKMLTRWYRTLRILHKFYPEVADCCWRCQEEGATMLHIFWSCPKLGPFWREVLFKNSRITTFQMIQHFSCYMPPLFRPKKYNKSILRHLLNAAKSCIPLK